MNVLTADQSINNQRILVYQKMNKMKQLSILFIAAFMMSVDLIAQSEETMFNSGGGIRLTGIWGGSNNALTDFEDDFNLSSGGFFTFEINNNFLIGWAGYDSDVTGDGREIDIKGNDLLLGYMFNSDQVIHPLFYLQTGRGKLKIQGEGEDGVFVLQPTVGAEINIARFFRLGIDGGYRFYSDTSLNGYSDKDFSGPVLGIRLKFGWSWGN
jgi:hypothetical protein